MREFDVSLFLTTQKFEFVHRFFEEKAVKREMVETEPPLLGRDVRDGLKVRNGCVCSFSSVEHLSHRFDDSSEEERAHGFTSDLPEKIM